ncbi:N-acetylmuramic acid 6-phosphate etherase [Mycoplasma sp. NEAQ87857]|uniref:N-acetylmuramic acid 6-phosphate etherase n=1 Tax=Mycoplasma sp. NEAQ87857 TaxID=2683967 RepID=UPI0013168434|nr:N-acetylmuramic acid 6-phosphate etherase [Mycoplasma sp. NEAQ87857]QGZ97524.1 N-acetylmuramic acid 6-phosphate etherase [Mycoplasma sp. NEAQ87857]
MTKNLIHTLDTEQSNPRTKNLSNLSSLDIVRKINYEDQLVAKEVGLVSEQIAKIIDLAYKKIKNGGRLIYIGAGTSGRIGVLDATEIYPTFGIDDKVIALIAGGEEALCKAIEGAEDNSLAAIEDLKSINFNSNDFLVGLAASGRTPYVISGIKYAKQINADSALICNVEHSDYQALPTVFVSIKTGPEAITGSTRMKAGTSQKMVCNIISSTIMIKLGYVQNNYMINLVPTNYKLEQRCINMIKSITKADLNLIEQVFKQTKNVKLSLMMIEDNLTYDQALNKYKEIYGEK